MAEIKLTVREAYLARAAISDYFTRASVEGNTQLKKLEKRLEHWLVGKDVR